MVSTEKNYFCYIFYIYKKIERAKSFLFKFTETKKLSKKNIFLSLTFRKVFKSLTTLPSRFIAFQKGNFVIAYSMPLIPLIPIRGKGKGESNETLCSGMWHRSSLLNFASHNFWLRDEQG